MENPEYKSAADAACPVVILMPVFNDWDSASALLVALDGALARAGRSADVLLVDDGSTTPAFERRPDGTTSALQQIHVLQLRRNCGHQRAIAMGLAWLEERQPHAVVVMDADGQDDPADVPRLLERFEQEDGEKIIFAERTKRSEGILFRVCYQLYQLLHRVLVGTTARTGNFSALPGSALGVLAGMSETCIHYAAAARKSGVPCALVPTRRASRLAGESRMNFSALVKHGLRAIVVHAEAVEKRMRVLTFAIMLPMFAIMLTVLLSGGSARVLEWTILPAVLLGFPPMAISVFMKEAIKKSRSQADDIPSRICHDLVETCRPLAPPGM